MKKVFDELYELLAELGLRVHTSLGDKFLPPSQSIGFRGFFFDFVNMRVPTSTWILGADVGGP